jgi:predicted permease
LIVLNSIFPVFGLILLGAILKRFNLTNDSFLKTSDRLIYFVFFPLMLFWKIGGASTINIEWRFCAAAVCALLIIYQFSWISIKLFGIGDFQAGTFSQSCYRFNTYIGMAIIMNAVGEEGIRMFGILIGIMIPIINVLAVATLIWYSSKSYNARERNRLLVKALVSNPLILGCLAGIIYANFLPPFPVFLDNTFQLTSLITLPLALLSIGGSLTFSSFKEYYKPSIVSILIKLLLLPLAGFLFFEMFKVTATAYSVGMIFFTLPTSTAIYVLSSQLNSDTRLATATIVVSTVFSIIPLTLVVSAI